MHAKFTAPPTTQDIVIVICRWYADAVARMDGDDRDWRWFPNVRLSGLWIDRCNERGIPVKVRWYMV